MVEARSEVVVDAADRVAARSSPAMGRRRARRLPSDHSTEGLEAYQFQFESPRIRIRPEFAAYALESFTPGRPMREALLDLTTRIYSDFRFDSKVTNVRTPAEEVFKKRARCVPGLRARADRLPALASTSPHAMSAAICAPIRRPGKPRLVGADASHAWVSAYCRDVGWLDMDPTNNVAPTDGHVTLAWGRDYGDVSPLRGLILGGGGHTLKVEVDLEPVGE